MTTLESDRQGTDEASLRKRLRSKSGCSCGFRPPDDQRTTEHHRADDFQGCPQPLSLRERARRSSGRARAEEEHEAPSQSIPGGCGSLGLIDVAEGFPRSGRRSPIGTLTKEDRTRPKASVKAPSKRADRDRRPVVAR